MEPNGYEDLIKVHGWYKRPKWLAALAALIASCSFAAFVSTTVFTSVQADHNQEDIGDLQVAIAAIEHNQEGIDELVAFVRDLQDRPPSSGSNTERLFQEAMTLLCASSDPARIEACKQLNQGEQ